MRISKENATTGFIIMMSLFLSCCLFFQFSDVSLAHDFIAANNSISICYDSNSEILEDDQIDKNLEITSSVEEKEEIFSPPCVRLFPPFSPHWQPPKIG